MARLLKTFDSCPATLTQADVDDRPNEVVGERCNGKLRVSGGTSVLYRVARATLQQGEVAVVDKEERPTHSDQITGWAFECEHGHTEAQIISALQA